MLVEELRDRMITLIDHISPGGNWRNKWLESRTSISAQKWANLYAKRQHATAELVAALAQIEPQYAEWLVTGRAPRRLPEAPHDALNHHLNMQLGFGNHMRQLLQSTYDSLVSQDSEMRQELKTQPVIDRLEELIAVLTPRTREDWTAALTSEPRTSARALAEEASKRASNESGNKED